MESRSYHTDSSLIHFPSSHILPPCQIYVIKIKRADTTTHQGNNTAILSLCHSQEILSQFLTALYLGLIVPAKNSTPPIFQCTHTSRKFPCWQEKIFHRSVAICSSLSRQQQNGIKMLLKFVSPTHWVNWRKKILVQQEASVTV